MICPHFGFFCGILLSLTCLPKKNPSSLRKNGFRYRILYQSGGPTTQTVGPEALRPTFSRGLLFSQQFHLVLSCRNVWDRPLEPFRYRWGITEGYITCWSFKITNGQESQYSERLLSGERTEKFRLEPWWVTLETTGSSGEQVLMSFRYLKNVGFSIVYLDSRNLKWLRLNIHNVRESFLGWAGFFYDNISLNFYGVIWSTYNSCNLYP